MSNNIIEWVENIQSLGFYSHLFLVPKTSNVEASDRPRQAQPLSTCRKVQNGNCRVHQGLPNSRGMGGVNRSVQHQPAYPHTPKLKEVPDTVPRVDNRSGKSEPKPTQVYSFVGYEYHLDSALVKPNQER